MIESSLKVVQLYDYRERVFGEATGLTVRYLDRFAIRITLMNNGRDHIPAVW
jgi:hypothetical protein